MSSEFRVSNFEVREKGEWVPLSQIITEKKLFPEDINITEERGNTLLVVCVNPNKPQEYLNYDPNDWQRVSRVL